MEEVRQPGSGRARRAARGRELLADSGGLWSALPVEWPHELRGEVVALPGWGWRLRQTLAALLLRPRRSFAYVQEPVDHATVLRFLLAVRLPLWGLMLAVMWATASSATTLTRPIHDELDPRLADAVSLWALLMVPLGVPLLYSVLGIATHVSLALTGGAPRSIAASMRAVGYALAPALLGVAVLDAPLHLTALPSAAYFAALGVLTLLTFVLAGNAITATHQISALRGFVVACVPAALFAGVQFVRAWLVLPELPWWSAPTGMPYFVP